MAIEIQGVPVPVPSSGNPHDFVSPEWQAVVDHYPAHCRAVREAGEEPFDPQPYLLQYAKGLSALKVRGRTQGEWIRRMIEHFGTQWMARVLGEMKTWKRHGVSVPEEAAPHPLNGAL